MINRPLISAFDGYELNDSQKSALIFVREVGAINNVTYRQISDCDALKASTELRYLRESDLVEQKGKGRGTYYLKGSSFQSIASSLST